MATNSEPNAQTSDVVELNEYFQKNIRDAVALKHIFPVKGKQILL